MDRGREDDDYYDEDGDDEEEEEPGDASSSDEGYNMANYGIAQALPVPDGPPPDLSAGKARGWGWTLRTAQMCPQASMQPVCCPSPVHRELGRALTAHAFRCPGPPTHNRPQARPRRPKSTCSGCATRRSSAPTSCARR